MRSKLFTLCFLSSFLPACGDDAVTGTGGQGGQATTTTGGGGAGGEGFHATLTWEPCTLNSDGTGPAAECARPEVPLRADDPLGKTIPVYVKRYAAEGSPRTKQLWMLAGGPGASSMIYEQRAKLLTEEDPTLEIFLPDHRGTGDSSRLGCPKQEGDASAYGFIIAPLEWPKCVDAVVAEWGDDLSAFNVTNAANDLGLLVDATRRPEAKVFVMGASYGTFWAQRYLQLFPSQSDGVILDAIAPPDASLARQDIDADETSVDLFQTCVDDPTCGPKLDDDPRALVLSLYDRLDGGFCPEIQTLGPAHILLRRAFGQMLMTWNARRLIPAAIARANRCNADDIAAINTLFDFYFAGGNDLVYREWGWVVSNHIVFSELWETPEVTIEQLTAWRENAAVSRDVTSGLEAPLKVMPRYPQDVYYRGFATTDLPMLMLQGTWDPATRPGPAQAVKNAYTGAKQYWVDVPRGGHGAIGSVPTVNGELCGSLIFHAFMNDPSTRPDVSCLDDAAPLTFDGEPALNQLLFGVDDAWGGL